MNEWWQSLVGPERVFWGIAIASTLLQILMFAGSLIAGSDVDADVDSDAGHGDAGVKFLSVRALVAFFVGFGWAGAMALARSVVKVRRPWRVLRSKMTSRPGS